MNFIFLSLLHPLKIRRKTAARYGVMDLNGEIIWYLYGMVENKEILYYFNKRGYKLYHDLFLAENLLKYFFFNFKFFQSKIQTK